MQRSSVWLLILAGAIVACRGKSQDASPSAAKAAEAPPPGASAAASFPGRQSFGEAIQASKTEPLTGLLERPQVYKGRTVVVEGQVRRACSRKGCWMELATNAAPDAPGCRVTFKDYGFFVPTDAAGSQARVEASVELATLSVAHVDHMESEGARFAKKNADGTAEEVRLVATGVELWR